MPERLCDFRWCAALLKGDRGKRMSQVLNVHLLGETGVAHDLAEMVPEQVGGMQWAAPPLVNTNPSVAHSGLMFFHWA